MWISLINLRIRHPRNGSLVLGLRPGRIVIRSVELEDKDQDARTQMTFCHAPIRWILNTEGM